MVDDLNSQIIDFIRDQFADIKSDISSLHDAMQVHVTKDETYWKKIDKQEGQLSVIKYLGGSAGASGVLAWLWSILGGHK